MPGRPMFGEAPPEKEGLRGDKGWSRSTEWSNEERGSWSEEDESRDGVRCSEKGYDLGEVYEEWLLWKR